MLLVTETSQMCNACITLLIRFLRSGNRRLPGSMTVRADRIDRTGFLLLSKNFVRSASP